MAKSPRMQRKVLLRGGIPKAMMRVRAVNRSAVRSRDECARGCMHGG